jgi:D-alanine-D-alanine ligase
MMTNHSSYGRIGVLMGGYSSEREISLRSGNAVLEALKSAGCQAIPIDITFREEDKILDLLSHSGIDLAFITLHGRLGEDGAIQAILEKARIPYTGSGVRANQLAINKISTQSLLKQNEISVPNYFAISSRENISFEKVSEVLKGFPWILKPACEGSSIGVSLVSRQEEFFPALTKALSYGEEIIVEQFIKGREMTVGILGDEPLCVIEVRSLEKFFDFSAKYQSGKTEYDVPAKISKELSQQLQDTALKAFRVLGCKDVARVDFMIDENQNLYVLEINTIPGMTATSLLPKAAKYQGLSFSELCLALVECSYGQKKSKSAACRH